MGVIQLWESAVEDYRRTFGEERTQNALKRTGEELRRRNYSDEQFGKLWQHDYCPWALPRGVTGRPDLVFGSGQYFLRNWVCVLDDVEIDGHEASDLDIGGPCIHCGMEWGCDE